MSSTIQPEHIAKLRELALDHNGWSFQLPYRQSDDFVEFEGLPLHQLEFDDPIVQWLWDNGYLKGQGDEFALSAKGYIVAHISFFEDTIVPNVAVGVTSDGHGAISFDFIASGAFEVKIPVTFEFSSLETLNRFIEAQQTCATLMRQWIDTNRKSGGEQ